jgi:hypothetical protein
MAKTSPICTWSHNANKAGIIHRINHKYPDWLFFRAGFAAHHFSAGGHSCVSVNEPVDRTMVHDHQFNSQLFRAQVF